MTAADDLDPVALRVAVGDLARALQRRVDREYALPKPPDSHLALLRLIGERGAITVGEAAEALAMKPNNVSALVAAMADGGMLTRTPDPQDRRVARLTATPEETRRLAEVDALYGEVLGRAVA